MTKLVVSAAVLCSFAAFAAEPSVTVQAEILYASTAPGTVEPAYAKLRDSMAQRVKYLTLKKLDAKRLSLVKNAPQTLTLPNQKQAELTLQDVKDNVATVKVKTPSIEAVYSLAKEKTLSAPAGAHDNGDLWLVVSQPK